MPPPGLWATVGAPGGPAVGMGWTSPEVAASWEGLWAAVALAARDPQRLGMDVSDVAVAVRPGFLARSMTVNATGARVDEHIYARARRGEMVYRKVDPETKRETDTERVIAVREGPLRMEFFQRRASDGSRDYWQAPLEPVKQVARELADSAAAAEAGAGVVGLGICCEEVKGVSHDSLWHAMRESVREPARFFACSDVSVKECKGFVQRTLTTDGATYTENVYCDEPACELVCCRLLDGSEADLERVVALRTHPLRVEFFQRSAADGFRVHWDAPRSVPMACAEAFVREAEGLEGPQPATVGHGVTSDPVRGCSFDSLLIALELSLREPWRVVDVDRAECSVEELEGCTLRRMRLKATGELVVERVALDEAAGVATFPQCDAGGRPGDTERVLAIRTPLRLELYERSACSRQRTACRMPLDAARELFSRLVQLATRLAAETDTVGYGLASGPVAGVGRDALWEAMLRSVRDPTGFGLSVENVSVLEMRGFLQRTLRVPETLVGPEARAVTENIHVDEDAREIAYRPVVGGKESREERVFALREDPLRLEVFRRHTEDATPLGWRAPRSVCVRLFAATVAAALAGAPEGPPGDAAAPAGDGDGA